MQGLGLSSLLILKELMATIALLEVKENDSAADHPTDGAGQLPLPCHYFDYIFGDGEGGYVLQGGVASLNAC